MKNILIIFISLICISCSSLSITDKNGQVKIERNFGFTVVSIPDGAEMITAEIMSFGYVSSPLGYNLGYSNQAISTSNGSCHVVLWVDEKVNLEVLENKLKSIDSVCISK